MKKAIVDVLIIITVLSLVFWFGKDLLVSKPNKQFDVAELTDSTVVKTKLKANQTKTDFQVEIRNVNKSDDSMVSSVDTCNNFRDKHPTEEAAFNEVMTDIYMSGEDASDTSVFTNMDAVSLTALANGGDKDALFFLGDGISIKAIYGKDFYGPKELRNTASDKEIELHKVKLDELDKGFDLLFKAGVRGKLGAFLSLQMNSDLAVRQLIRTEAKSDSVIISTMAKLIAYNRLLAYVHKKDEPHRLMFAKDARNYYGSSIQKHFENWKPNISKEMQSKELQQLHDLSDKVYQSLEKKWVAERQFNGLEIHRKLLKPELVAYLMQVSDLCWN